MVTVHTAFVPCVLSNSFLTLYGVAVVYTHAANDEKCYRLYNLWWQSLKDLVVWKDEQYLTRKGPRMARDERKEIIPLCVIKVRN